MSACLKTIKTSYRQHTMTGSFQPCQGRALTPALGSSNGS